MEKTISESLPEIKPNSHLDTLNPNIFPNPSDPHNPVPNIEKTIEDTMAITQNKRMQSETLRSPASAAFLLDQKPAELNALINDKELSKIKKNPWEINVAKTISNFQNRIYANSDIKFRIGGRVIHSTSRIVNAKSNLILRKSVETQQVLDDVEEQNDQDSLDDMESWESMNDILGDYSNFDDNNMNGHFDANSEELKAYIQKRNEELTQNVDMSPFYNVDRTGQRFLSAPIRKVFRKVDFADLGQALSKSLTNQLRRPSGRSSRRIKRIVDASEILPEHLLKNAEADKALVEEQIQKLFMQIERDYSFEKEPVPFLKLILTPDPDGIVRTLLYILQLVNRKKIDVWQQFEETETPESSQVSSFNGGSGLDIFVSPKVSVSQKA